MSTVLARQVESEELVFDRGKRLEACERRLERVESAMAATAQEGHLLLIEIRDHRLYPDATFEVYMQRRWGKSKSWASRTISAAEIRKELPIGNSEVIPESQLRELKGLPEGERAAAWKEAEGRRVPGSQITAAQVKSVVAARLNGAKGGDQDGRYAGVAPPGGGSTAAPAAVGGGEGAEEAHPTLGDIELPTMYRPGTTPMKLLEERAVSEGWETCVEHWLFHFETTFSGAQVRRLIERLMQIVNRMEAAAPPPQANGVDHRVDGLPAWIREGQRVRRKADGLEYTIRGYAQDGRVSLKRANSTASGYVSADYLATGYEAVA